MSVHAGRSAEAADHSPVSTGRLPPRDRVEVLVRGARERFRAADQGQNAAHYPALARVPRDRFGICLVGASGAVVEAGDADVPFTIVSVAKPFVVALVREAIGAEAARAQLGVNATGLAFDSVMAIEINDADRTNPMVNAGAIADLYPRQSALGVTASDPATMAATLADDGANPPTGERVVGAETCRRTLAVMAAAGLYETSGNWLSDVGLPGKSGVGGGIITVAPGKGGLGTVGCDRKQRQRAVGGPLPRRAPRPRHLRLEPVSPSRTYARFAAAGCAAAVAASSAPPIPRAVRKKA